MPITKVFAGRGVSVAVGQKSTAFVWGAASGKNLGVPSATGDVTVPQLLEGLGRNVIQHVTITDTFTAILTTSG